MLWLVIAVLAGGLLPVQTGINAQLTSRLGSPVLAAAASVSIAVVSLFAFVASLRLAPPALADIVQLPWWIWLGGAIGALYLVASLTLAQRLGAASLISALVAGQTFGSIIVDHLGLVGYGVRHANWRHLV